MFAVHDFNNIIILLRLVNIRIQNKNKINVVNYLTYYGFKHNFKYQNRTVMADVYFIRHTCIVLKIGFKMILP